MYSNKQVKIDLKSKFTQEGVGDEVSFSGIGNWNEDEKTLIYEQNGNINTIKLENDFIVLSTGSATILKFKHQQTTDSQYGTDYGALDIQIFSKLANALVIDDEGDINLDYEINQQNVSLGQFKLHLRFQPVS
jgi:uncharacterized beta-barrel protein YwiB (DUF1934 family)